MRLRIAPCILTVALAACASTGYAPVDTGNMAIEVSGGGVGAVVLRITGPEVTGTTLITPSDVYAKADSSSEGLTIVAFGDKLSGTVTTFIASDVNHPERYKVAVLEAADTANKLLDPAAVTVKLVSSTRR